MSIKPKIIKRIYEVLGNRFGDSVLHIKDEEEPGPGDPFVRFVLVSPYYDDKDTESLDVFGELYYFLQDSGLYHEFFDYYIIVMPMSRKDYVRYGNSIWDPDDVEVDITTLGPDDWKDDDADSHVDEKE